MGDCYWNDHVEEKLKICEGLATCLTDNREPGKVKHPLAQLISQRVYQIAAGYPDTNDSNYLRHDPIFKMACERIPIPGEELLASQPTMSRLENQVTLKEIKAIRRFFIDQFLQNCSELPEEIILDIDGWDALTHGHQQLSLFHGYYGHTILKLDIKADRLSCHRFIVNQFRLFLSQAAYILMLGIRQAAQGTRLAKTQVSQLRALVIKTAAKVSVSVRRVLVELPAHCPFASDISRIAQQLYNSNKLIFC